MHFSTMVHRRKNYLLDAFYPFPSASGRLLHISSTEGLNIGSYGQFNDIYESFGHKFQNLANFEKIEIFWGGGGKIFQNRVWYRLI